MKKINKLSLFPISFVIIFIYALSFSMFDISPLGKLLNPFIGVVQNEESMNTKKGMNEFDLKIKDSIEVFFDDRKVPHIFAKNNKDIFFAQGFVTANFRLWQMDFISYLSAGRLAEILGEKFVEHDRFQRRKGFLEAAKNSLLLIEKDSISNIALTAYTDGVNAYIDRLNYKNMPFEYKLLDYKPERWTNLKSVLIIKYMADALTGYQEDAFMTNMILALGEHKFNELFSDYYSHSSSIEFDSLLNANNKSFYLKKPEYLDFSFLSKKAVLEKSNYNPNLGSNSWAVSGKKTTSGFPILCCDPHLKLSFPSIWFEMQLITSDLNVYGVSIPGTPGIILGFNKNIAWGSTNGSTDVKDWYKLKINSDYTKYEFENKWLNLTKRIETIKVKNHDVFYDTIYSTIHGPIVGDKNFAGNPELTNYALKWELAQPSNEFLTYIKLNFSNNYNDYSNAIKHYKCPIQNFVFACKNNDIAINYQGNVSVKWPGQGKFIMDGTKESHLYKKYVPYDSLPHLYNPKSNFVYSANQHPTYSDYGYYYNGFYNEARANRIRTLLENKNLFSIEKMKAIQLDNTNPIAEEITPHILSSIITKKMTKDQLELVTAFKLWNYQYDNKSKFAKFFELWWDNIAEYTWDEFENYSFNTRKPYDYILIDLLLNDPNSSYFDNLNSSYVENSNDIIYSAFLEAYEEYNNLKNSSNVNWEEQNNINIMHLTDISAFSKMKIPSSGHANSINAITSGSGPSWRMIVQLGERPVAYGIYAGGQSGNIGSYYYDNFVNDWNKGRYFRLNNYFTSQEAKKNTHERWILK